MWTNKSKVRNLLLKGKECKHTMQYRRQYTVNYFLQQHSTCPKSIFNVNFGHNLEVHAYWCCIGSCVVVLVGWRVIHWSGIPLTKLAVTNVLSLNDHIQCFKTNIKLLFWSKCNIFKRWHWFISSGTHPKSISLVNCLQ